jgi:sulfotransferase
MRHGIHFISGLPRSGSTLLAAILRQNPTLHADITSPVGSLFLVLRREMGAVNETSVNITDDQRQAVLRGLFDNFYCTIHPHRTIIDTNRSWCAQLATIAALFPDARVIACVRHVPWVLDSIETLIQKNLWQTSKIFDFETGGTTWSRVDRLASANGMVGFAWNALKQAFYGNEASRMMLLRYETLTRDPAAALTAVYGFLNLPPFDHDFNNVTFSANEFDARLGTPRLHSVGREVHAVARETVLPPDLWRRFENDSFWHDPALNPRGVTIV